jgi:hypothetical protein
MKKPEAFIEIPAGISINAGCKCNISTIIYQRKTGCII